MRPTSHAENLLPSAPFSLTFSKMPWSPLGHFQLSLITHCGTSRGIAYWSLTQPSTSPLMAFTPKNPILFLLFLFSTAKSTTIFPKEAYPTQSGYLPVNGTSSSSLFYTFYEAQTPTSPLPNTPLLLWLQGGPGCSSMIGNFFELGPYLVSSGHVLNPNPNSWNRVFGLLFIDSPVGTGFSFASSTDQIPNNQITVAAHLWSALQAFLSTNNGFRSRPFYITGESYAGKYVPATGYYILQQNSRVPAPLRINLQGVAIGNGLTHPVTQVSTHAATAYFSGLINARQEKKLEELQQEAVRLTVAEKWAEASDARSLVLHWLQNATGLATLYDLTRTTPYETYKVGEFLKSDEVRAELGVRNGIVWEECSGAVGSSLHEDIMKSVKFMVEELLRRTRVMLYQGQFDLRDGVVSTEAWVEEMEWDGVEGFMAAERKVWRVGREVAGYVQTWRSLTHVVVSGAGHLVPADQGRRSQAMIEDWVLENGLFGEMMEVVHNSRRSF